MTLQAIAIAGHAGAAHDQHIGTVVIAKLGGDLGHAAEGAGFVDKLDDAQADGAVAGHPVVLSALFDDAGLLRGIRMVSDPRATPTQRRMAHLLGVAVIDRYGTDGWTCKDLPPAEGESAVGGVFIKRHCEKALPVRALIVETHFLRKPGQHDIDPETREYTQGEFESWTRFELFDPTYRKP